ncbi:unnamed protein product [Staurois parvus]|uniref:Uncharacterized protein n=1 Tax=Staurois parvus TaxID=386267 RepID=A0ABN9F5Z1_9NEOB|nr:unnamed protein product [Staurois parvus]
MKNGQIRRRIGVFQEWWNFSPTLMTPLLPYFHPSPSSVAF